MSDGTAGEPTLGEIYWDTWSEGARKIPYPDLAGEYREHTERAATAVGAAAIARLNQPEELRAAVAGTRQLREQLAEARKLGTAWRRERDALAAENAETARALDIARDEITGLRNLAADILGEFKASGDGHRARIGQVGYARWAERAGLGG